MTHRGLFISISLQFSPNWSVFLAIPQKFLANSLHVSILMPTFAIATIIVRSTPHEQRARRYVQAQPTFSKRCGLIFLPITAASVRGEQALCSCGALRIMWRCQDRIRRFAFHVFLLPFVAESTIVVADEEGRAAFFVPLRQPAPERFSGNKATTIVYYANICIYPAHRSTAPV